MRLYQTVDDIKCEMETLYRNITGKDSFTAGEADIVYGSIVDAYQRVLREYGVADFRFHIQDITVSTVTNQKYIDLPEYVFRVEHRSVRIPLESALLGIIDEVVIFQNDPRDEIKGIPEAYAYKNSGDPNIIRLRLYPTPDAIYVIHLKVLQYPTDAITNFPTDLVSAIKNKAKSLSCLGLGLASYQPAFDREYEKDLAQIKDGYDNDGPKHASRTFLGTTVSGNIQSRIRD